MCVNASLHVFLFLTSLNTRNANFSAQISPYFLKQERTMTGPTVDAVDPPPPTDGFESGLAIPPLDAAFFSQIGNGSGMENNQNDVVLIDDLDLDCYLDFSLDDLYLPYLGDLLNPTELQQSNSHTGTDPNFAQFASGFDEFSNNEVLKSIPMELSDLPGNGDLSRDHSSNGSGVLTYESPEMESHQISGYLNVRSDESNGLNHSSSEKVDCDAKGLNYPSPESQGSGNCGSNVSEASDNLPGRSVSSSPNSNNSSIRVVDQKINLESKNSNVNTSLLKRKKEGEELVMDDNVGLGISKLRKSNCSAENNNNSHANGGLGDEDDKRKARLMRNRESAQLSRQRKKHYVEELEDKVKAMNSMIQDLNAKISYFMAENVTLRQQMGGARVPPPPMAPPPPGMYPHPAMMYPWMQYAAPYMVKPQGSQVPLVPIPRLKPQQPAPAPKLSIKVDLKKNEGMKTKKVAGVSFLGLLFFIMLFGGLVPMVNMRYGGVREAFTGGKSYIWGGFYEKHHGRVLMVNGTEHGGRREFSGNSSVHCGGGPSAEEFVVGNRSDPLVASLYVPRNDKLVKIDGNLIIHSVLASEKAMASYRKGGGETALAVPGDLSPTIPMAGVGRNSAAHPPLTAADGKLHQWFREGFTGPMLTSGMCREVFQFDVSSAIVPFTTPRNISEEHNNNSTRVSTGRNRRILYDHPIPLPNSSHNISRDQAGRNSQKEKLNGNNNASSVVVSVLVDPREAGDADMDGVLGTKSLSRIFVVVLIDSVKYVTYSCMLPFMGSATTHLVTT